MIEVKAIQTNGYGVTAVRTWNVKTVDEAKAKLADLYYQLLKKTEVDVDKPAVLRAFDFSMSLKAGGEVRAEIKM